MDKSLIEKVQKLLNLAQSSNEHESRLAAERAAELMIKHNISQQMVGELSDEEYESRDVFQGKVLPFEAHWAMMTVREHFFVEPIYLTAMKKRWMHKDDHRPAKVYFVGTQTNVEVATYVFNFLRRKFKELWKDYQERTFSPNSSKGSYYAGLVVGLDEQLSLRRQTIEQDKAMVLVRDPKLDVMTKKFHGKTKEGSTNYDTDYDAMHEGRRDGREIKIQKGIENKTVNKGLALDHKK